MNSGDSFLLFEFLDGLDDEDGEYMSEENLAEKRAKYWRNFDLRDAVSEVDTVPKGDLPDVCETIRSSKIEAVKGEFEDLFNNISATKALLAPDIGLLKQYPNEYSESGANYWRSVKSKIVDQLESYYKKVKSSAISELQEEREEVSREIADVFEKLKKQDLESNQKFAVYYYTWSLWQNAMNNLGEAGLSPSIGGDKWKLVKLIRGREFNKPSVVADYITPSSEDPSNFHSQKTTLSDWVSEDLIDEAEELYGISRILSGNGLRNELKKFLLRR